MMERVAPKVAEEEGRFSRWSRLKTGVVENELPQLDEPLSKFTSENLPVRAEGEELLASSSDVEADGEEPDVPLDLPDIETLEKDSDYTPFLAEGVPESIRKLALRKLWASDPVLANIDGLNDYDEDFTIIEAIKTFVSEGLEKLNETEDNIYITETDESADKEEENKKSSEKNVGKIENVRDGELSENALQVDKEISIELVPIVPKISG
jgi:hypothetical protein